MNGKESMRALVRLALEERVKAASSVVGKHAHGLGIGASVGKRIQLALEVRLLRLKIRYLFLQVCVLTLQTNNRSLTDCHHFLKKRHMLTAHLRRAMFYHQLFKGLEYVYLFLRACGFGDDGLRFGASAAVSVAEDGSKRRA